MRQESVERSADVLPSREVRHLIVGGRAVVGRGHVRFIAEGDLVLDPDPIGLRPGTAAGKEPSDDGRQE